LWRPTTDDCAAARAPAATAPPPHLSAPAAPLLAIMETTTDDDQEPEWRKKQKEYEIKKARAKALKLKLTCSICSKKAKLNCPCGTTQYCSTDCQRIDWRDRGHRKACKKIRDERAAEAARAEAPTPPQEEIVYGPAPRSHADEIRARIAAEHEAARARREANPEPVPEVERFGSRCPICLEEWDVNASNAFLPCCARLICRSCDDRNEEPTCPVCRAPVPKNDAEGLARLRRHVENDLPEAVNHLGQAYRHGFYGILKNPKKAAKIFKRGVELGDSHSMYSLGKLLEHGSESDGVKVNKKKAKQLYRMAADRGYARAQFNVSYMLSNEGPSSYRESFRYCKLAADRGYTSAEYNLAISYKKGEGVDVDLEEARRWYARAAAKGHEKAAFALSCMLYNEGPSSYRESFRYCKLAADRGYTSAEYNLAISYKKGEGVDVDREEARRWYARAAAKGYEKAASALAKLDAEAS
jgi:TPR repeat protein